MNSLLRFPRPLRRRAGWLRCLSTAASSKVAQADTYCVDLVKKHDFDSFLCGLLVPKASRAAYFAVKAFNVEIALVKDQTHGNLLAGKIRFQWWRDLLDEIYKGGDISPASMIGKQPVAQALSEHVPRHDLSQRWFLRSLDARQQDFSVDQLETLDDLENYAEQGHSSILYLLLEALGVREEAADFAASHVGVSAGITTVLRAFPHHAQQSQVYLPRANMERHGLRVNAVLKGPESEADAKALRDCVFDVASQAYGHLDKARQQPYPPQAVAALLPAVRSSMFLEALRKADFDPSHPDLYHEPTHVQFQLKVLYASVTKRI